jgi:glycerol-3-phosphate cytidylyltransferase
LNILKRAKKQCDYLIVGVTTDELCKQRKGKTPIIPLNERMEIVSSIKYVDKVVPQQTMDKFLMWESLKFDVVFVGSDWQGTLSWNKYEEQFANVGVNVVYLQHTDGISSTKLAEILESLKYNL